MRLKVSVVIPCNHQLRDLTVSLLNIMQGSRMPDEIIVVHSRSPLSHAVFMDDSFQAISQSSIEEVLIGSGIKSKVVFVDRAYPGDARNIGVKHSTGDLIAFLDVQTLPTEEWLMLACEILEADRAAGVWGSCFYVADSYLSSCVLDVIYGRNPVRSVAGTVFLRECVETLGQMVSWARAGEDGDWINRVEMHKLNFVKPDKSNVKYTGLSGKNYCFFGKKWWEYYHFSRLLSINSRDRWISYFFGYITLGLLAFNWNYNISEFVFGASVIVPHITKAVLIGGPAIYIIVRGFYLPLRRGVPLIALLPARFVFLIFVSATLDFIKIIALLTPVLGRRHVRQSAVVS